MEEKIVFVMHNVFNGTQIHIFCLYLKITKRNRLDYTENYFLRVSKFHASKNTELLFKGKTMFSVSIHWLCQSVNVTQLISWVQNVTRWHILSDNGNAQLLGCGLGFFLTFGYWNRYSQKCMLEWVYGLRTNTLLVCQLNIAKFLEDKIHKALQASEVPWNTETCLVLEDLAIYTLLASH